jgi:hypothetical protein
MPVVGLRCPDGTWVPVEGRIEVGRGFRGLDDEKASRVQFAVTSQDGSGEACLHIKALGINRMPKTKQQFYVSTLHPQSRGVTRRCTVTVETKTKYGTLCCGMAW